MAAVNSLQQRQRKSSASAPAPPTAGSPGGSSQPDRHQERQGGSPASQPSTSRAVRPIRTGSSGPSPNSWPALHRPWIPPAGRPPCSASTVHSRCPRRDKAGPPPGPDRSLPPKAWDAKAPQTYADCPSRRWNNGVPTGASAPTPCARAAPRDLPGQVLALVQHQGAILPDDHDGVTDGAQLHRCHIATRRLRPIED